jgi:ribosomal protein S18 acetylase RimI-like enzyme
MKIVDYHEKFAKTLADMWNESEEGWPGGLTRGTPMTTQRVREDEKKFIRLGSYIVMEKSKAIGYVRVSPYHEEKEAAYVSWLNVIPEYHGKSYGRKLLCRSVECSCDHKLDRLDLHTWPGNIKALPAYKKTGFFWVPKSTVYMQNFIPMIMRFGPVKSYFKKHDWYHTFQRPIELTEDKVTVEGMNVFPHKWKEGKDEITVWIDNESRGITGFENKEMKVYAKLNRHDVLAGMNWKITWKVVNKTKRKMSCSLKATPPKGVSLRAEKKIEIPAGKSKEISTPLKVSLEAKERDEEEKADSVLTRMKINNQSFSLRTGLRTKQAIMISTDPEFISIIPGKEKEVYINLKNNLKRRTKGRIRLKADGLELDKTTAPFTIQKNKPSGITVRVRAKSARTKNYSIKAWAEFEGHRTKQKSINVRCLDFHGAISDIEEDRLVMENEEIRLVARKKGGLISLADKASRDAMARNIQFRIGPPFVPSELARLDWKMSAKNERSSTTGTISVVSQERKGLKVTLNIRMSSNNLVQIVPVLENRSRRKIAGKTQNTCFYWMGKDAVTIPTRHGIIHEEVIDDDFPDWMGDVPNKGYFGENWVHMGNPESGLGLIWDRGWVDEIELSARGVALTSDAIEIKPGEKRELPPLNFVVATYDWKTVRKWWLRLSEGQIELEKGPDTQRVFEVGTIPKHVVLEDKTEFKFRIRNLRNKRVDADVNLGFPKSLKASRTKFQAKKLSLENPLEESITIDGRKANLGVHFAKVKVSTPVYDYLEELPIVVIGRPGSVSVRQKKGRYLVDNGFLTLTVAPDFAGSLTSLKADGVEHLLSAYPKPDQLSWMRPWYGGIRPTALKDAWFGQLYDERFEGKKVTRGPWKGVGTTTSVRKYEKLRGLRISTEYMTRPNSNVVAVLQDFTNTGRSSLYFEGGCHVYFQVGGSKNNIAHFGRSGWRLRKYSKNTAFSISDNQAIVVSNPRKSPSASCHHLQTTDFTCSTLRRTANT